VAVLIPIAAARAGVAFVVSGDTLSSGEFKVTGGVYAGYRERKSFWKVSKSFWEHLTSWATVIEDSTLVEQFLSS
jgi:hypothetical protein